MLYIQGGATGNDRTRILRSQFRKEKGRLPAGHTSTSSGMGAGRGMQSTVDEFGQDFEKDIVPYVEGHYRVLPPEARNRAIAGCPWGGADLKLPSTEEAKRPPRISLIISNCISRLLVRFVAVFYRVVKFGGGGEYMAFRTVKRVGKARPTMEGAGVRLHRAFGFGDPAEFDPFLLLDDFRGDTPGDYQAGFPWHPHRGMETITYVLAGTVEHGDSMGNSGIIGAGDVQWMTAGSGIIHQEMPKGDAAGRMYGFQLWANLPASLKMTSPRYQEVKATDIPVVKEPDGTGIRIICGNYGGASGPVNSIAADPVYLDISVSPGNEKRIAVGIARNAFAYVFAGAGRFGESAEADNRSLLHFSDGEEIVVRAGNAGVRFLLVSGIPLGEPVAWQGPIVMNTREELRRAFEEIEKGTFLNRDASPLF